MKFILASKMGTTTKDWLLGWMNVTEAGHVARIVFFRPSDDEPICCANPLDPAHFNLQRKQGTSHITCEWKYSINQRWAGGHCEQG